MMFLEGVRVLDLSRILAGPFATQALADMGAEVLKIESPDGDDTRTWGPPFSPNGMSAYFQSCNRNKASLVLDFKQRNDFERLMALVAKADVVIDNFPPMVRKRLGLDASSLRAVKPDLILLSITGYREDSARADEPGYDLMIQAESGLMWITGPETGEGFKVGVALVDVMTGMMASNGILAALFARERRGHGADLQISLYQTALFSLVNVASNYLVSGSPTRRHGNKHPNIVPYQAFQTKDAALVIGAGNDRQYQRLCAILGLNDPRFIELDNRGRVENRERLTSIIAEKVAYFERDVLLEALRAAKIPAAPILSPAESLERGQTWGGETFFAMAHPKAGELKSVSSPLVSRYMRHTHTPPPELGEAGAAVAARWLGQGRVN